jgi:entry exclusion lipoprotein TrbK
MKKYILYTLLVFLSACTQEVPETPKNKANKSSSVQENLPMAATPPLPDANDENCKRQSIEAITDKQIQRTLADNCSKRSPSVKPIKHKPWVF